MTLSSHEQNRYRLVDKLNVAKLKLSFSIKKVPKTNYFVFNFLASFAMVPKAQLIVYYMKDGEIISDTIDVEFGEELHNFVSFLSVPSIIL